MVLALSKLLLNHFELILGNLTTILYVCVYMCACYLLEHSRDFSSFTLSFKQFYFRFQFRLGLCGKEKWAKSMHFTVICHLRWIDSCCLELCGERFQDVLAVQWKEWCDWLVVSSKDGGQTERVYMLCICHLCFMPWDPNLKREKRNKGRLLLWRQHQWKKAQISLLLSCVWGEMVNNIQVGNLGPCLCYLSLITDTQ